MEYERKEFDSPQTKLEADAAGLIAEAARRSELLGKTIDPVDCIKRKDDVVAALTLEIRRQQEEALDKMPPQERWLLSLKSRFNALQKLHEGIKWSDVEKSLKADPETMEKLMAFDERGHGMNVFGEEDDEFIFVSAWNNCEDVAPDHRNITYDTESQRLAEQQGYAPKGNAVNIIAGIMGVEEGEAAYFLADPKFHGQLIEEIAVKGWAWIKTDATTRKAGDAFCGSGDGFVRYGARSLSDEGSFRVELRVKKV